MRIVRLGLLFVASLGAGDSLAAPRLQAGFDPFSMAREMRSSSPMLLGMPDVKKELKLSDEQGKKIEAIRKAYMDEMNALGRSAVPGSAAAGNPMAAMEKMRTMSAKAEADVRAELSPEQATRLRALQYQAMGAQALYAEDLQKTLALTPEQVTKVSEVRSGDMKRTQSIFSGGTGLGDPKALQKKMKEAREEGERLLMAILTPEQTAKYRETLGKPVKSVVQLAELAF